MQIHYLNNLDFTFKNSVLTVGSFDGVHLGHQKILQQMIAESEKIGGETVLLTFHPHPRLLLQTVDTDIVLLNTWEEKIKLLEAQQLNHLLVVEFNAAFAALEPEQYIEDFLVRNIHPSTIIIGYDHRFGKGRKGDFNLLNKMAAENNYTVQEINEEVINDVTISSTKIRKALLAGDIALAKNLLGYNYALQGIVVEGKKLGRTIGYPTANITIDDAHKLIPGNGVYAVTVYLPARNTQGKGMMNIGNNPTVNGQARTIEVNIFDFGEDIYGEKIEVTLIEKMRNEIKFDGLDALMTQLADDETTARQILIDS